MVVVAQCRTRVNGLTRIVDHVAPSPAMIMRCIALVRIVGIAKTQISVWRSRLKEIAQCPVFHIVETMKFNAKIQLTVMDVELILAAYTMIQLLFARPPALFNVPIMNGHVGWEMMILDVQHLKAALLMENVLNSPNKDSIVLKISLEVRNICIFYRFYNEASIIPYST